MKKGIICIIAGLLLIAAALSITGYNLWDDRRADLGAHKVLDVLETKIEHNPIPKEGRRISKGTQSTEEEIEYPDYVINPDMDMPVEQIDGIYYVGKLSLSAIDMELPVCENWDYSNLKTAPCRYIGTAYLDNMVICAHNYDGHFGNIKNLSYGDAVTFTDMDGNIFTYKVMEIETLDPYEIDEMTTGDWDLTLFTCTAGGATRVTVRCGRV